MTLLAAFLFLSANAWAGLTVECDTRAKQELVPAGLRQITAEFCRRKDAPVLDEATKAGLGGLAACPAGNGFRPLSSVHPPTAISVGFDYDAESHTSNLDFIKHVADVMKTTQPGLPLNIVVPRDYLEAPRFRDELLHAFSEAPYSSFVNIQPTTSTYAAWARDYMCSGVEGSAPPKPTLHAMVYNNNASATAGELAAACDLGHEPTPPRIVKKAAGNVGGNIVPFPGGVVAVGDTMAPEVKTHLFGAPSTIGTSPPHPLVVKASWLQVGHVDEMFNVVPTRDPAPCNFAILYSSPKVGLDLAGKVKPADPGALEPGRPDSGSTVDDPRTALSELFPCVVVLNVKRQHKIPIDAQDVKGCPELAKANLAYEKVIQENLAAIRGEVAARSGCRSPKTQALPQLYIPKAEHAEYGGPDDGATALNPNPVNSLVMNRTLVVPEQRFAPFKRETDRALKSLGLDPHYVDDSFYHFNDGEIHCGTNEIRTCSTK